VASHSSLLTRHLALPLYRVPRIVRVYLLYGWYDGSMVRWYLLCACNADPWSVNIRCHHSTFPFIHTYSTVHPSTFQSSFIFILYMRPYMYAGRIGLSNRQATPRTRGTKRESDGRMRTQERW